VNGNNPSPDSSLKIEAGLSPEEQLLLDSPLPSGMTPEETETIWASYQSVVSKLLVRMGRENNVFETLGRTVKVGTLEGIYIRFALIPKLFSSAMFVLRKHGVRDFVHRLAREFSWLELSAVPALVPRLYNSAMIAARKHGLQDAIYRLAGECSLMELSAAAGYRTFCFPNLIRGLLKTNKMRDKPVQRMMDTFDFLTTMMQRPLNDSRVAKHLERTNNLHSRYSVAGAQDPSARDLFKYIALNMFYIGPRMRPDLSPQERHAICGLTVLTSERMGHRIEGSVRDLERFITEYEASYMFSRDDPGVLRRRAVEIARASQQALSKIPSISPDRIHGYVPYYVKMILELN
jgi:hypothetical protein